MLSGSFDWPSDGLVVGISDQLVDGPISISTAADGFPITSALLERKIPEKHQQKKTLITLFMHQAATININQHKLALTNINKH